MSEERISRLDSMLEQLEIFIRHVRAGEFHEADRCYGDYLLSEIEAAVKEPEFSEQVHWALQAESEPTWNVPQARYVTVLTSLLEAIFGYAFDIEHSQTHDDGEEDDHGTN
jgi:hypothetical protein